MLNLKDILSTSLLRESAKGPATHEKLNFHPIDPKDQDSKTEAQAHASDLPATSQTNDASARAGAKKGPATSEALKFHTTPGVGSTTNNANASILPSTKVGTQKGKQDD